MSNHLDLTINIKAWFLILLSSEFIICVFLAVDTQTILVVYIFRCVNNMKILMMVNCKSLEKICGDMTLM